MLRPRRGLASDRQGQLVKCDRHPPGHRFLHGKLVMPSADVLQEGVHRFAAAPQLCSWAGLTPRHRESDTTVRRGPITKQGPRLVRWAAVEATQRLPRGSKQAADFHRIADRRGTGIGRVAAARRLLTLVYYGLRDGQVRCLAPARAG
jgi:transposase